ncbi:MAG: 16S rRNA processing protein RimM [Bacilli bacterium]|nr:16S rRNA processing protein RimM [Bacilli bacterium]
MKILIGNYVTTHGIKGEIRIKSNFKYKDKVFMVGNKIYLDNQEFIINSYRVHKEYDMVTLDGINNINDILPLKGSLVYVEESDLNLKSDEYLDTDLIGCLVYIEDALKGEVTDIEYLNKNKMLLKVNNTLVPFELVKKIDLEKREIILEKVDGLL